MLSQFSIQEIHTIGSISYILEDESLFYGTSFKVFTSQDIDCLLPCAKSRWNGKIKLHYFTKGYRSLKECVANFGQEQFRNVILNIIYGLLAIEDNGFLSMKNVVLTPKSIYVDINSMHTKLVYLPLTYPILGANTSEICDKVCALVLECIQSCPQASGMFSDLQAHLIDGKTCTLNDLIVTLNGGSINWGAVPITQVRKAKLLENAYSGSASSGSVEDANNFVLLAQGSSLPSIISLQKPETVLGRSNSKADCVITSSSAISRMHCKLSLRNGKLFVTDLGSANGTFVDQERMASNSTKELIEGAQLRLADVGYIVKKES